MKSPANTPARRFAPASIALCFACSRPVNQGPRLQEICEGIVIGSELSNAQETLVGAGAKPESHWSSPGFVDIPGSVLGARGVTHGETQETFSFTPEFKADAVRLMAVASRASPRTRSVPT